MENTNNPLSQQNNEIRELKEEIAHDKLVLEQAAEIVREENKEIHKLERELDKLEHSHLVELVVNAEPKEWKKPYITYKEIVILAFDTYNETDGAGYSGDYSHGPEAHKEGILDKGESVPVKNKMRFRVTPTNRS